MVKNNKNEDQRLNLLENGLHFYDIFNKILVFLTDKVSECLTF